MSNQSIYVTSPLFNEKEKRFEDIVEGGDPIKKSDLKYIPELLANIENLQSSLTGELKQKTLDVANTLEFYTGASIKNAKILPINPINFSPTNVELKYDMDLDIDFKRDMLCRDILTYIASTNILVLKFVPVTLLYKSYFEYFIESNKRLEENVSDLKEKLKKKTQELKDARKRTKSNN